jgi:recombination protein RecA
VTDIDAAAAKAYDSFIADMQNSGKQVFSLGDDKAHADVQAVPTGVASLDVALGVGGLPLGRIVELYGLESSGKTSLALSCAAQFQKSGHAVGFVDAEHAMSPDHARAYGVDLDHLAFYQPDHGQDGLEMARSMVRSNAMGLVIIDSVAALIPKEELEGNMEDLQVGAQARMMSKAMRMLSGDAKSFNTTLIFINQIREKVGVMMGNPNVTPGGKALKFFSSVRMEVFSAAGDRIHPGDKKTEPPIGQTVRVKIAKNKVAPPMRRCEFKIFFDHGVDVGSAVLDAGKTTGLLTVKGASISDARSGERLAVGKGNFSKLLADDPALADELTGAIHALLRGELELPSADAGDADDTEMAEAS